MSQVVAKRISRARVGRDAWVYELSKPVPYELRGEKLTTSYVTLHGFTGRGRGDQPSVVIYPSDQYGDVLSYGELPGSYQGGTDHDRAIRDAGWVLDSKSVRRQEPSAEEARVGAREHVPPTGHGYRVGDRVEVNLAWPGAPAQWFPAEVVTVGGPDERHPEDRGRVWVKLPNGNETDLYQGVNLRRPHGSEAQDFPTQDAAVEHAYKQTNGERLYVYHEAGKFHLASPGQEPVGATPISMFRRPGEYGMAEAREDTAPVIYEEGAREQPGPAWPAPETLAKEHVQTTMIGEASPAHAQQQGDCLPWVRVTRDPERYAACLADARRIGPIDNARKVYDLLGPTLAKEDQEVLMVVLLDVRRQLRGVAEVHRGQRSRVSVGVVDVMRVVIATGAEAFVVCHAHPSGNSKPSEADVDLTRTIADAAKPYGKDLTFISHVVIGMGEFHEISAKGAVSKVYRIK